MNPVAMTVINPRKEYWPSRGSNQRPPVLKSATLLTELCCSATMNRGALPCQSQTWVYFAESVEQDQLVRTCNLILICYLLCSNISCCGRNLSQYNEPIKICLIANNFNSSGYGFRERERASERERERERENSGFREGFFFFHLFRFSLFFLSN